MTRRGYCGECGEALSVDPGWALEAHEHEGHPCAGSGTLGEPVFRDVVDGKISDSEWQSAYDAFKRSRAPWAILGITEAKFRAMAVELAARENQERLASTRYQGGGGSSVHTVSGGLPGLGRR